VSAQGRTGARTANRFTYFAAQPVRGDRTRIGTDLAWAVGPASLKFEWSRQINERIRLGAGQSDLDDLVATGWYVAATWLVTGEEKPLTGPVVPKRSFNPITGQYGIGAWEIGLRYAELAFESDDPVDFFDANISNGITGGGRTAENGVEALTAGVNWYLNSRVRYMINWTQYWYDNALGTPFSCNRSPGCSSSAQLRRVDDPTSYEFLTRIQLFF
jgi:phosphate-selective porin